MNGMSLLIYSVFTLNLVLQCAIGIRGIAESKSPFGLSSLIKLFLIFLTVILLWLFFSRMLPSVFPGLLIYILLFPVSAMVYDGLEYLTFRYIFKNGGKNETIINSPGIIASLSVFVCVVIAGNFLETVILSFGFVFGIFLLNLIIREIRRRAALEAVPSYLRGKPLVLITLGLLSMVFSTVSVLIFGMIGAG